MTCKHFLYCWPIMLWRSLTDACVAILSLFDINSYAQWVRYDITSVIYTDSTNVDLKSCTFFSFWCSTWWRHQMETISASLVICAGNSSVTSEFPAQRPVTRSFDVFFYLRLNKRFSKQWRGWWFKTPWCPLWRHCNEYALSIAD